MDECTACRYYLYSLFSTGANSIFNCQNCLKLQHALKTKGSSRKHQRILTWKSPFFFKMFLERPPRCTLHWWCSSGNQLGSSVVLNLKNMLAVWSVCSDIIINIVVWKASNILYSLGCFCILGLFCFALSLWEWWFISPHFGHLADTLKIVLVFTMQQKKIFYVTNIKLQC